MMTTFAHSIVRVSAWILVIIGVLFSILQAFLIGIPALAAGVAMLWAGHHRIGNASSNVDPTHAYAGTQVGNHHFDPFEKNDPTSLNYVADDADGANPMFGFNDHLEDRDLDRYSS